MDVDKLRLGKELKEKLCGIGGGAPRARIRFTDTSSILIHWGPAGSFVDTTIGDNLNTGNLLALTDVGRYDLSAASGSAYTDRTAALALVGTRTVERIDVIIDSFGGNDRNFDILGINGTSVDGVVPEPGTIVVWSLLGLAATGCGAWRQKQSA